MQQGICSICQVREVDIQGGYGQPYDISPLLSWASWYGCWVLHGHGLKISVRCLDFPQQDSRMLIMHFRTKFPVLSRWTY